jgi:hypothetical protein
MKIKRKQILLEIGHTIILVYSYADIVNDKLFHIIWR